MRLEIYPKFQVGDKVRKRHCIIQSHPVNNISCINITVYGVVKEILIMKDFWGMYIYRYRLDDGEVYTEDNMELANSGRN